MNTFRFDLRTQGSPFLRLGIHGLWRLLYHTQGYPGVEQTPTLKWESDGEHTLTLHFESLDDLNLLMDGMYGGLEHGVVVPPGYRPVDGDPEFVMTVMAHKGLTQIFKGGQRGAARTRSWGTGKVLEDNKVFAAKTHPEMVAALTSGCFQYPNGKENAQGDPAMDKVNFTPHTRMTGAPFNRKPLQLDAGKNKQDWSRLNTLQGAFHPAFTSWNNNAPSLPLQDAFALSFSGLGHLFCECEEGVLGIGLDLPSFAVADKTHTAFRNQCLFKIHTSAQVAAFLVLTRLRAPVGKPYPLVLAEQSRVFFLPPKNQAFDHFAQAMDASVVRFQKEGTLRILQALPLGKEGRKGSVYDQIYSNLEAGLPWYFGFQSLSETKLFPSTKEVLEKVTLIMENENHALIRKEMGRVFSRVVANCREQGFKKPWEQAESFVVKTELNRANTESTILGSLSRIVQKAGCGFSPETWSILDKMLKEDPRSAQALLILSCYRYHEKKSETNPEEEITA